MLRIFKNLDWLIFLPIIFLGGFSLSLLASPGENLFLSQLVFFVVGLFFFFLFLQIDWQLYKSLSNLLYLLSLFLLLITFLGPQVRGATRWIDLFGFRWQPSEMIKPLMAVVIANFFAENEPRDLKTIFWGLLFLVPPLFFIFRQPDLGNAIILSGVWLGIVYSAGLPFHLGLLGLFTFFFFLPFGWFILRDYQKARIVHFLNPFLDPGGAGYNSIQAMIAVGSGQFFGRGLGQGTQSHLLFLPEYHTDFIFASLVEELGFIGGFLVILAYAVLLFRILQIARQIHDPFASLLLVGIFSQIALQVFINIGMNLGVIPITGITLPLLSYGGSSVLSMMITLGIVANVSKSIRKNRALDILPSLRYNELS